MCATLDGDKTGPELNKPLTEFGDRKNVGFLAKCSTASPVDGDRRKIAVSGSFSCSASRFSMAVVALPTGSDNVGWLRSG